MARLRTLTNLLDDLRKRADIENVTDRFPDAELTEYLNQSIARLYSSLDMMDHTYYQTFRVVTTVDNTGSYSLPANFWHMKRVTLTFEGKPYTLRRFNPLDTDAIERLGQSNYYPVFYELAEDNIILRPTPAGDYDVTLYYAMAPQRLTTGSDTFDGVAGFEEWVILNAAIKVRRKNRQDATDLMSDAAEVWSWIESTGHDRDVGQPIQVADLQDPYDGGWNTGLGPWPYGRF